MVTDIQSQYILCCFALGLKKHQYYPGDIIMQWNMSLATDICSDDEVDEVSVDHAASKSHDEDVLDYKACDTKEDSSWESSDETEVTVT